MFGLSTSTQYSQTHCNIRPNSDSKLVSEEVTPSSRFGLDVSPNLNKYYSLLQVEEANLPRSHNGRGVLAMFRINVLSSTLGQFSGLI